MGVYEQAQREVELYKKEMEGEDADYVIGACESALKAFKSLCDDGHSGCSFGMTLNILNRLAKGLPLTSVDEDTADWYETKSYREDVIKQYKSSRISGFYKEIRLIDGEKVVGYTHLDRTECVNINNPVYTYYSGLVDKLFDEMHPITLPYSPLTKSIRVFCEDFLYDKNNGDFDTVGVFHAVYPDGKIEQINRFFHYDNGNKRREITKEEYDELKKNKYK